MAKGPFIAAFDIASITGVCLGCPGDKPIVASLNLKAAGTARPRQLFYFSEQLRKIFERYETDQVRYEAPLNIRVLMKIGAHDDTVAMLRGAIGVLEAEAARAGIEDIGSFDMHEARRHLTGFSTFPRVKGKTVAKAKVWQAAKMLGVVCQDYDQSDAFCGWSYCCALANPRLAHISTPLFGARSHGKATA